MRITRKTAAASPCRLRSPSLRRWSPRRRCSTSPCSASAQRPGLRRSRLRTSLVEQVIYDDHYVSRSRGGRRAPVAVVGPQRADGDGADSGSRRRRGGSTGRVDERDGALRPPRPRPPPRRRLRRRPSPRQRRPRPPTTRPADADHDSAADSRRVPGTGVGAAGRRLALQGRLMARTAQGRASGTRAGDGHRRLGNARHRRNDGRNRAAVDGICPFVDRHTDGHDRGHPRRVADASKSTATPVSRYRHRPTLRPVPAAAPAGHGLRFGCRQRRRRPRTVLLPRRWRRR